MKQMLLAALVVAVPLFAAETERKTFDSKTVKTIEIRNAAGKIKVAASTDGKTEVIAEKVKFGSGCSLRIEQGGSTLQTEVKEKGIGRDCEVNIEVRAPAAVALEIKNGYGDVNIEKTTGPVEFEVGAGNVTINSEVPELDGKVGAGKVEAKNLTGDADVRTGSGTVKLAYTKAPNRGDVEVRTGTGDVELTFPAGTAIRTDFKSGTGQLKNELGDAGAGGYKVSVHSGTGNLHIKKTN